VFGSKRFESDPANMEIQRVASGLPVALVAVMSKLNSIVLAIAVSLLTFGALTAATVGFDSNFARVATTPAAVKSAPRGGTLVAQLQLAGG
jgi:hypothetical protein